LFGRSQPELTECEIAATLSSCVLKISPRFRWVFCQLEALRHCLAPSLRQTLEELPESLDETYERILKGINRANQRHAHRLLQCLTVADRPLRVEDLAEVLAVDFNAGGVPKFNATWRWEDQEEVVLSACSSLVSVITDNGSRVVQFSHFSVKEFLTSDRLASSVGDLSYFHIPLEPAHTTLARACLGVLHCVDDHAEGVLEVVPLVQYAAKHWVKHVQFENVELRIKDALDYFFDMDKPQFATWVKLHDIDKFPWPITSEWDEVALTAAAPLSYAARCGFYDLVGRLVGKSPQLVNARGGRCGAALHAALVDGHTEVAQLLFEHGADLNSRGTWKWTPLHVASAFGHLDAVKWLLDHGTDVNDQQAKGWTPLLLEAANGHVEVSRVLLGHKAEANVRNVEGSTSLHEASEGGYQEVVRLLLDHDADVDGRDNNGKTPAEIALNWGWQDIVQLLSKQLV
jgi:hypothetical protein